MWDGRFVFFLSVTNLVDYTVTGETEMWTTFTITERPSCVFFFYIKVNSIFSPPQMLRNAKSLQLSWQIERKYKTVEKVQN